MIELKLHGNRTLNALIDDEDLDMVSRFTWYYHDGYAATNVNKKTIYMHRLIANTPKGLHTDHINHNKLDNRKANLRVCNHLENMQNLRKKKIGSIKKLPGNNKFYYYGEIRRGSNRYRTTTCETPEQAQGALKQLVKELGL